jgi:hypothetical protein
MKTSEIIDAALDLLPDESYWCQGTGSREVDGKMQHCIVGAVMAVDCGRNDWDNQTRALEAIRRQLCEMSPLAISPIGAYNDSHTFADAIALMEKARAALQEAGE